MNIVIPMAGQGSRFATAGFTEPKPFIHCGSKFTTRPDSVGYHQCVMMIDRVIENICAIFPHGKLILIVQADHLPWIVHCNTVQSKLREFAIIVQNGKLPGAACSVLLAKDFIDNSEPLVIANSDQLVTTYAKQAKRGTHGSLLLNYDSGLHAGCILTFQSQEPRWSYVKLEPNEEAMLHTYDSQRHVDAVVEKQVVSEHATCGIYLYQYGRSFVHGAEKMMAAGDMLNGEFYVAPAYNYIIDEGAAITIEPVQSMLGLGTPEDFNLNYEAACNQQYTHPPTTF